MRFDRAFCTAPLCSPARGSLFTGRFPHSNGLMGLAHLGWEYRPGERTLPMLLGGTGYETALVGLQHESADSMSVGFDRVIQTDESQQYCGPVARLAAAYLRDPARRSSPFFLTVGMFETHRPYPADRYTPADPAIVDVPPFLPDTQETREDLAAFHGSIAAVDEATGAVLAALEDAGLADDTWVIFTSDHGIAFPRAKSTLYDPGLAVALVMRLPRGWGRPPPALGQLVSHVDVVPTILERLGLEIPPAVQGSSFGPLLSGEPDERRDIFGEKNWHDLNQYDPMRCIRTRRHKYIRSYEPRPALLLPGDIEASRTRAGMGDDHLASRPSEELYDLDADPLEQRNLAGDDRYEDTRRALAGRLDDWRHRTGDPLLDGPIPAPSHP